MTMTANSDERPAEVTSDMNKADYQVQDLYHSQITKPLKIICVGNGISGLYLAFRLCQRMESFELAIYEKNTDVGGTYV